MSDAALDRVDRLPHDVLQAVAKTLLANQSGHRVQADVRDGGRAVVHFAASCRAIYEALKGALLDEARLQRDSYVWPQGRGAKKYTDQLALERASWRFLRWFELGVFGGLFLGASGNSRELRRDFNTDGRKCYVLHKPSKSNWCGCIVGGDVLYGIRVHHENHDYARVPFAPVFTAGLNTWIVEAVSAHDGSPLGSGVLPMPDDFHELATERLTMTARGNTVAILAHSEDDAIGQLYFKCVLENGELKVQGGYPRCDDQTDHYFKDYGMPFLNSRNELFCLVRFFGQRSTIQDENAGVAFDWKLCDPQARDTEKHYYCFENFDTKSMSPMLEGEMPSGGASDHNASAGFVTTVAIHEGAGSENDDENRFMQTLSIFADADPEAPSTEVVFRTPCANPWTVLSDVSPNGQFVVNILDAESCHDEPYPKGCAQVLACSDSGTWDDFTCVACQIPLTYDVLQIAFTPCSRYALLVPAVPASDTIDGVMVVDLRAIGFDEGPGRAAPVATGVGAVHTLCANAPACWMTDCLYFTPDGVIAETQGGDADTIGVVRIGPRVQ